jgi:hypothetical protein
MVSPWCFDFCSRQNMGEVPVYASAGTHFGCEPDTTRSRNDIKALVGFGEGNELEPFGERF